MKFNGSILVLGDLGQLKAYRVTEVTGIDRHESAQVSHQQNRGTEKKSVTLDLITEIDYIESHMKTNDIVSDQAGRFGTSTGEAQGKKSELDRRTLKMISEDIRAILEKELTSSWCLAFPKEKNNELQEMLSNNLKKQLKKVVPSNLTKISKNKILSHFE